MPIVLDGEYLGEKDLFEVSVLVHGIEYRQTFTPEQLAAMVSRIETRFEVAGFLFVYNQYDKRDIGPRARRSFVQYFTALLAQGRK